MQVNSRHHLRSDAVSEVQAALADRLGVEPGDGSYERVAFEDSDTRLVLVDGEDMAGESGRVVESLHHVGDELYELRP